LCSAEGLKSTVQALQSPVDINANGKGKGKGKEDGIEAPNFFTQFKLACKDEPTAIATLPTLFADQLAAAKVHRAALAQWKMDFSVARTYKGFESICTTETNDGSDITGASHPTPHGFIALVNLIRVIVDNQGLLSGNSDLIGALHATVLWTLTKIDDDNPCKSSLSNCSIIIDHTLRDSQLYATQHCRSLVSLVKSITK
jgi:hypothetical protein